MIHCGCQSLSHFWAHYPGWDPKCMRTRCSGGASASQQDSDGHKEIETMEASGGWLRSFKRSIPQKKVWWKWKQPRWKGVHTILFRLHIFTNKIIYEYNNNWLNMCIQMLNNNNAKQIRIPHETSICFDTFNWYHKISLDFSRVQGPRPIKITLPNTPSFTFRRATATSQPLTSSSWNTVGLAAGAAKPEGLVTSSRSSRPTPCRQFRRFLFQNAGNLGSQNLSKLYGLVNEIKTFWMSGLYVKYVARGMSY